MGNNTDIIRVKCYKFLRYIKFGFASNAYCQILSCVPLWHVSASTFLIWKYSTAYNFVIDNACNFANKMRTPHSWKYHVMSLWKYFCIFIHKNITCHVKYTRKIHHLYPMGCIKLCVDIDSTADRWIFYCSLCNHIQCVQSMMLWTWLWKWAGLDWFTAYARRV